MVIVMTDGQLTITGSWLDAIGQTLSAIAYTSLLRGVRGPEEEIYQRLIVVGEGLQAVGNSLNAVEEDEPVVALGDWVEAAGAATSSYANARQLDGETLEYQQLEVLGDALQSLGPAISNLVEEDGRFIVGNNLQTIGAALEATGGIFEIRSDEQKGLFLSTIGNWLQAAGTTLQAIIITRESTS
ncbi:hypothetical protein [Alkalihalobacillus sp. LMS39]|uniref:DUF6944 family repetitive protein n=1 Tax=Alkalihalobacillus sp. LMS39 TaxID=2924032 RepID=UPI001FB4A91F|nr:hypothetical protein [Alkalihalobacillus sp. LMS39]UOE94471.1 hypothetical protein MM271_02025 [Alkalihalobacillus sp. LMS39]